MGGSGGDAPTTIPAMILDVERLRRMIWALADDMNVNNTSESVIDVDMRGVRGRWGIWHCHFDDLYSKAFAA